MGVRSIAISMSVCLYVCLLTYMENRTSKFHQNFLCVFPVAVALSSSDASAICTSAFVDDMMFYIMERMGQNQKRCVCFSSPGGGTGVEVCRLR